MSSIAKSTSSRRCLRPCSNASRSLKIVFEHITTGARGANSSRARAPASRRPSRRSICSTIATRFFQAASGRTIYCLPILKRERDRQALRRGRHRRQSALLPRHRQRAARAVDQGERLRLRRHVHRARGDRTVCGGVRASRPPGSPGGLCQPFRRGFLRTAAPQRHHHLDQGALGAPGSYEFGNGTVVPYRGGEAVAWRLASAGTP